MNLTCVFRLRREVGKAGEEEEGGSPNLQLEDQVVPLRPMKSGVVIYLPTSRSQLLIRIRSFIWIRTEPDMQHGLQYSFFFFFFLPQSGGGFPLYPDFYSTYITQ